MLQSLGTTGKVSAIVTQTEDVPSGAKLPDNTASPLSPEDQLRKEVQDFPPLPTNEKSNGDWMDLPEFAKLIGKNIDNIRSYFSPSKKPIKVTVGQTNFGRCGQGGMEGIIWGQVPPDMKLDKKKTGYFILKTSIPNDFQAPTKEKGEKNEKD